MAPKKSTAAAAAAAAPEVIEEIVPEPRAEPGRTVTFVLDDDETDAAAAVHDEFDNDAEDEHDHDDDDDDADLDEADLGTDDEDELTVAVGQLTQLMMTEDGEAITDVLNGIRDALDKQNKILYRGLQVLEARFARK